LIFGKCANGLEVNSGALCGWAIRVNFQVLFKSLAGLFVLRQPIAQTRLSLFPEERADFLHL
jgi:hypothetical protein